METVNTPLEESQENVIAKLELPGMLQILQVVKLQFRKSDEPITATIKGVHIYRNKIKYDLGLWLGDGSVDDPERECRIYNVDAVFVTPV